MGKLNRAAIRSGGPGNLVLLCEHDETVQPAHRLLAGAEFPELSLDEERVMGEMEFSHDDLAKALQLLQVW